MGMRVWVCEYGYVIISMVVWVFEYGYVSIG